MATTAELGMPADRDRWVVRVGGWVRSTGWGLLTYLVVGLLLLGATAWGSSMATRHDPARSGCGGRSIVALELAGDATAAREVVEGWGSAHCRAEAQRALSADGRWFVPAYSATLAWWCAYVFWAGYRRSVRRLAGTLTLLAPVAGLLDLAENAALHQVVAGRYGWATTATTVSLGKWLIVLACVVTALVGAAGAGRRAWGKLRPAVPEFFGQQAEEPAARRVIAPARRRAHADPDAGRGTATPGAGAERGGSP